TEMQRVERPAAGNRGGRAERLREQAGQRPRAKGNGERGKKNEDAHRFHGWLRLLVGAEISRFFGHWGTGLGTAARPMAPPRGSVGRRKMPSRRKVDRNVVVAFAAHSERARNLVS